jgi:phosphoserine phosphatase RsbU/P
MKILIAEDDTVSRVGLAATLKKLGHDVVATEHGRQTWDTFRRENFPILISDWMMPGVDGLELCRMIRAENRARYTYVILLTVLGGKGSFLEGMRAGADDFITKPFDEDELAARLHVAERIVNLQREFKQLQGLLPICSYCKRIRDEQNRWHHIEDYIASHTDASFSHGVCRDCFDEHVKPDCDRLGVSVDASGIR